jgi:hypothetical protein
MEKKGAAVADRPRFVAAQEILSRGMRILPTRAGDRIRRMRRALHSFMQYAVATKYGPIQIANAKNVVLDILENPTAHAMHARRWVVR